MAASMADDGALIEQPAVVESLCWTFNGSRSHHAELTEAIPELLELRGYKTAVVLTLEVRLVLHRLLQGFKLRLKSLESRHYSASWF